MNNVYILKEEPTVNELISILRSQFRSTDRVAINGTIGSVCINEGNQNIISLDTVPATYVDDSEVILSINSGAFYLALWHSGNEAIEPDCDAVIGYMVYGDDKEAIDGGEIDYNSETQYTEGLEEAVDTIWDILLSDDPDYGRIETKERLTDFGRLDESLYQITEL